MPGNIADWADGNARLVKIDQQKADTFLLFAVFIGAHKKENMVGVLCQCGPCFLAVDDKVIAVINGFRTQAGKV